MVVVLIIRVFYKTLKAFNELVMSKNSEKVFYAVGRGKEIGIYDSWKECKAQTEGIPNAKYRKFYSYEDAEEFVNFWRNYSTPVKEPLVAKNLVSSITDCDGSAAATNGGQWAHKKVSFKTMNSSHSAKNDRTRNHKNHVLGYDTTKQDCKKEGTVHLLPYISPLSTVISSDSVNFVVNKTNKWLKIPSKAVEYRSSFDLGNRVGQDNLRMFNDSFSAENTHSNKQNEKCKGKSTSDCQKSSGSIPTTPNNLIDNSDMHCSTEPFAAPITVPLSGSASQMMSEPCSGIPSNGYDDYADNVSCIGKDKVSEIIYSGSSGQNNSSHSNGQMTEVIDKLTSCLNLLGSVLKSITNQNINVMEKLKNSLEPLLGMIPDTCTETNTNVNPQMEPQGNVDLICDDTKNFHKDQPAAIQPTVAQGPTSSETQSSEMSYAGLQSSPSQLSFAERRMDQKHADILALNLRLDSFEKRFDTCLKEFGALAAEISHIKSDVKELKETLGSAPKKGSNERFSPSKAKDGRVQTTLNFASDSANNKSVRSYSGGGSTANSEELGVKEGRNLKRKLSRSDSSEKSKRFADDDMDDILGGIKIEKVDYTSFTLDEDDYVEVYTDGSALSNGKGNAKAGIGIWFGVNHPLNVAEPVVGPPTNNTAEIQAARVAIQLAIKAGITKLKIHTDSEFLINCATKWIHRWKTNGWTLRDGGPVKNKKELEKLDKVASKISVRWEKVAAHSNNRGNETADRLANEGAAKYER